jgi:hypothetical protein
VVPLAVPSFESLAPKAPLTGTAIARQARPAAAMIAVVRRRPPAG